MKKKGISPLIATVLIIGLTIALAAIIMNWGTDLVDIITGQQQQIFDKQQKCQVELNFKIESIDCTANTVTVDNKGSTTIKALRIRLFNSTDVAVANLDSTTHPDKLPIEPGYIKKLPLPTDLEINLDSNVNKIDMAATVPGSSGQEDVDCIDYEKTFNSPC